ncbi:MAG: ABC transporter permease, partial [Actinomycetota bacterium]|nr:ABC transporter permease [Actinomycetota bacterium]
MSAVTATTVPERSGGQQRRGLRLPGPIALWVVAAASVAISLARAISDNDDLTSANTFGVAIRTAAPIALAGLGGLYAERSGTINIGLEGMMIMGTVFAGWWAWEYNPWMGVLGGVIGGALGGLVHALATVTFGVNHIVSGFAINILAPGVARFMANLLFEGESGGSVTNSPGASGEIGVFTMPVLSGGPLFAWKDTPDPLGNLVERQWFLVSDISGLLKALTTELRLDLVLVIVLFFASVYVLWRTRFGLRLRSAGERPSAADSLGVSVVFYRYVGMLISGGLAGMAGSVLVIGANRYSQGQTGGRGFLGLATLVVGNWRPAGVAAGAGLFGFFDGITQRIDPGQLILAAILAAAILLGFGILYSTMQLRPGPALIMAFGAAVLL